MEIIIGDYKIAPYGDTCWQVKKRNARHDQGNPKSREWGNADKYPSTLSHALRQVRELIRLENGSTPLVNLDRAISDVEKIDERFEELVKDLNLRPKDLK